MNVRVSRIFWLLGGVVILGLGGALIFYSPLLNKLNYWSGSEQPDELVLRLDRLDSSITALESDINTVRADVSELDVHTHDNSSVTSSVTSLDSRLTALESRLTSLSSGLSILTTTVDSLPASIVSSSSSTESTKPANLSPVLSRLSTTESDMSRLMARLDSSESSTRDHLRLLFAYRLRDRIDLGLPFDVTTLAEFIDSPVLARLSAYGSTGIPSLSSLRSAFIDLRPDLEALDLDDSDSGVLGRLAVGVIRVRTLTPSPDSTYSRIENALVLGDLDSVIELESDLSPSARRLLSDWYSSIRLRRSVDSGLDELMSTAVSEF